MRKILTGLLAAVFILGLALAAPVQAKVYKMSPEERTAALKEKRAKRSKAKKSGKKAPGEEQGGWVEVKPGEKIAKKHKKKDRVEELSRAAEMKGEKSAKAKAEKPTKGKTAKGKSANSEKAENADKPEKKEKSSKKSRKSKADKGSEEIVVERKGAGASAEPTNLTKSGKSAKSGKSGRTKASRGDRVVGGGYSGGHSVQGTSTEVRRTGPVPAPVRANPPAGTTGGNAAPAPAPGGSSGKAVTPAHDDLSSYSVSRPGQDKAPAAVVNPEVRQGVQPGPVDQAKPVGTERGGEGRF